MSQNHHTVFHFQSCLIICIWDKIDKSLRSTFPIKHSLEWTMMTVAPAFSSDMVGAGGVAARRLPA